MELPSVAHRLFAIHKSGIFMCYRQNIYYCVRSVALPALCATVQKIEGVNRTCLFRDVPERYRN